jgi:hypothetical protein
VGREAGVGLVLEAAEVAGPWRWRWRLRNEDGGETPAEQAQEWAALAGVLRRILGGERSAELLDRLDSVDTAIVQETLRRIGGGDGVPTVWRIRGPGVGRGSGAGLAGGDTGLVRPE